MSMEFGRCSDGVVSNAKRSRVADWEALPDVFVDAVSKQLPLLSTISMGLTCKSWRRILAEKAPWTMTRGLPWLMFRGQNHSEERKCFSFVENRVRYLHIPEARKNYCWGSIQDWLIVVELGNCMEMVMFFYNPFSKTTILYLPMIVDHYYKIVLSNSPAVKSCVFVLLRKTHHDIACWIPGMTHWYRQHLDIAHFDDAVFCNKRFYFITRDFNIWTITEDSIFSELKVWTPGNAVNFQYDGYEVEMPDQPEEICTRIYLVESCGEVLLVLRLFRDTKCDIRPTLTFKVFKLDTLHKKWEKMESLGDRVLFIGNSDTRSFSGKELGVYDCIFFFNDCVFHGDNEWIKEKYLQRPFMFDDWGVFSMERNCIIKRYSMNPPPWPPVWITAPVWWYLGATTP